MQDSGDKLTTKYSNSWGFVSFLVIAGWILFVWIGIYFERKLSAQNWSTTTLIIDFSFMYLALLLPAVVIAFVVGKGVKKYRSIPNARLVVKAFWVTAAFLALLTVGYFKTA